jgi:bacteriorhodopsin
LFTLSDAAYMGMLYTLFKPSIHNSSSNSSIMWFVLLPWSLFPVVWILALTRFGIFTLDIEAILYLALDLVTKIGLGIYVSKNDNHN